MWLFYAPPVAGARPKNRGSFSAIVPLNNQWDLRAFGVTQQAPAAPPAAGAGPVAGHTLYAPASILVASGYAINYDKEDAGCARLLALDYGSLALTSV